MWFLINLNVALKEYNYLRNDIILAFVVMSPPRLVLLSHRVTETKYFFYNLFI